MQTFPKVIWTSYLIIGLLISVLSISCVKLKQYSKSAQYSYVNQTNYDIKFPKGTVEIFIKANSTTSFEIISDADKEINEHSYTNTPFDISNMYRVINFDSIKCLNLFNLEVNNPSNLRHYKAEKISERKYKFTYTFTEADYNRAVTCP